MCVWVCMCECQRVREKESASTALCEKYGNNISCSFLLRGKGGGLFKNRSLPPSLLFSRLLTYVIMAKLLGFSLFRWDVWHHKRFERQLFRNLQKILMNKITSRNIVLWKFQLEKYEKLVNLKNEEIQHRKQLLFTFTMRIYKIQRTSLVFHDISRKHYFNIVKINFHKVS